jgi:hypothetical protein
MVTQAFAFKWVNLYRCYASREIPEIYFQQDFNLSHTDTFTAVGGCNPLESTCDP